MRPAPLLAVSPNMDCSQGGLPAPRGRLLPGVSAPGGACS